MSSTCVFVRSILMLHVFLDCLIMIGVMGSVLSSSAVDLGFEPLSGQTKDYKIGICCFSAKHAKLRRISKDLLARNHNNVSDWSDISTRVPLFQ